MKLFALIVTTLIFSTFTPSFAVESGSSGTDGGGQAVPVDNQLRLRDLIDKSNCFWLSAEDFAKKLPHFKVIEKTLVKYNPYFASVYKRESRFLSVCQTYVPLVKISVEDNVEVTSDYTLDGLQYGRRIGNVFFIDMNVFKGMPPVDQVYGAFHEVCHSFISPFSAKRNTRLRSFVDAVQNLETEEDTPEIFLQQLTQNDMTTGEPREALLARVRIKREEFEESIKVEPFYEYMAKNVWHNWDAYYESKGGASYRVPARSRSWVLDPLSPDSPERLARDRILEALDIPFSEGGGKNIYSLPRNVLKQIALDLKTIIRSGKTADMLESVNWQDLWLLDFAQQMAL